jgi:hypothetical protein
MNELSEQHFSAALLHLDAAQGLLHLDEVAGGPGWPAGASSGPGQLTSFAGVIGRSRTR